MESRVNHEVPQTKSALVSIGVDLVAVLYLVRDDLVQLAAFELHLLLIELVLDHI